VKSVVKFKDGYICEMEHIYNWDRMHMFRTETSYLFVPYGEIELMRVEVDEFMAAQKAAKELPIPKAPKPMMWKEVLGKTAEQG
jgi:hypothetical protein